MLKISVKNNIYTSNLFNGKVLKYNILYIFII